MNIYFGFDHLPKFRRPAVTVGSFDGVHYGHRRLLDNLCQKAKSVGGESVVVTFSPHPRQVLPCGGNVRLLTTLAEKTLLLSEIGVDNLVVVDFTPEFSTLSSRDFVTRLLCGRIGMKQMVVGYNHRFGHDSGDAASLETLAQEYGFSLSRMPQYLLDGRKVSSTAVRNLIETGAMVEAAAMLTAPYFIVGDIFGGVVYLPDSAKLLPPDGRYEVEVDGSRDSLMIGCGRLLTDSCRTATSARITFV